MRLPRSLSVVLLLLCSIPAAFASAYNARPKLVVIILIDQFRGDYLERYRDQFGDGGFRVFLDRGAYFTDCYYDYANTRTAPGHATLLHRKLHQRTRHHCERMVGSAEKEDGNVGGRWHHKTRRRQGSTAPAEIGRGTPGASPHNLMSDTLGDELKLATGGKARVFAISLKDRAAILPAGFSGDAAYWIDGKSGDWITSTYYRADLPEWVRNFNGSHRAREILEP